MCLPRMFSMDTLSFLFVNTLLPLLVVVVTLHSFNLQHERMFEFIPQILPAPAMIKFLLLTSILIFPCYVDYTFVPLVSFTLAAGTCFISFKNALSHTQHALTSYYLRLFPAHILVSMLSLAETFGSLLCPTEKNFEDCFFSCSLRNRFLPSQFGLLNVNHNPWSCATFYQNNNAFFTVKYISACCCGLVDHARRLC